MTDLHHGIYREGKNVHHLSSIYLRAVFFSVFQVNKRNWVPEPGEEAMDSGIKKQKSVSDIVRKVESSNNYTNDDSNIGNESDSDADYDDLDDLALPSDNDDFLDDDGDPDEDDKSVHSTATTVSDSSACSNTPSLIGESLETSAISTQDTAPRKHAWVNMQKQEVALLYDVFSG